MEQIDSQRLPEQKFSRYRSQRQSRSPRVEDPTLASSSSPPLSSSVDNATNVTRQPSRYHRQSKPAQSASPSLPQSTQEFSPVPTANRKRSQGSGSDNSRNDTTNRVFDHASGSDEAIVGAERRLSPRADLERRRRLEDNSTSRRVADESRERDQYENHAHESLKKSERLQRQDSPVSSDRQQNPVSTADVYAPREIKAHRIDEKHPEEEDSAGCFGLFRKKKSEEVSDAEKQRQRILRDAKRDGPASVSYTHLTLPTKRIV